MSGQGADPARGGMAFAAAVLLLATFPREGLGAQLGEAAPHVRSASHGALAGLLLSGSERSPRAAFGEWGHYLELAALDIDSGKLGAVAGRAVRRWPAVQEADPAWGWERVLVFLVQAALIAQGHDPGKTDGLMGPRTMLALLAWSAASGPSWQGIDGRSYQWGIDANVAHLLHGTLAALGLFPGPKDRFLGRESVAALERWDDTFRRGGHVMRHGDEDAGTEFVMNAFGADEASGSEQAASRSTARESTDRTQGSGYTIYECLEISWSESTPACHSDGHSGVKEGKCSWELALENTCSHGVVVHLLVDREDGRGPFWEGGEAYEAGETRGDEEERETGHAPMWAAELPEHVRPVIRYCAHMHDLEVRDWGTGFLVDASGNRWYRNDVRDAQGVTHDTNRSFWDANHVPNPTCMDAY